MLFPEVFIEQIKQLYFRLQENQMQITLPVCLMTDSDPNFNTPQEKLRKISFDATDLNQLPLLLNKKQSYVVDGWGNQNWDLKAQVISNSKKQKKPLSRAGKQKTIPISRPPLIKDLSKNNTKYIQKLEEKLVKLVTIKEQKTISKEITKPQVLNQNIVSQSKSLKSYTPHYQAPKKPIKNYFKTSSTSQSQIEKFDHNFTNANQKKNTSIKIKKNAKQILIDPGFKNFQELDTSNKIKLSTRRQIALNSTLTCYEPIMSHRSKQVTMISYPMIEADKIGRRGVNLKNISDIFKRFNFRNSSDRKQIQILGKESLQRNSGFSKNERKKTTTRTQDMYSKKRWIRSRQKSLLIQFEERK